MKILRLVTRYMADFQGTYRFKESVSIRLDYIDNI